MKRRAGPLPDVPMVLFKSGINSKFSKAKPVRKKLHANDDKFQQISGMYTRLNCATPHIIKPI